MMGQLQLNMTWHNTFATVGHFHATVVLGTTSFMGLVFFVIRTMFMRQYVSERLASIQPFFYSAAMGVAVLMMMYVGILYGVPRRTAGIVENIPGTEFSLSAAAPCSPSSRNLRSARHRGWHPLRSRGSRLAGLRRPRRERRR